MAHQLFTLPKQVNLDASANILAGAKATFYLTGTSTLQDTYSDSALTTPNANPVVADSNGVFSPIYLDPTKTYKVTLTTAAGVLLYTADPANDQLLSQAVIGGYLYPQTAAEQSAGVTPVNYAYPPGNVLRYGAKGDDSTDNVGPFTAAIAVANASNQPMDIVFPEGIYRISESQNWYVKRLTLRSEGRVVIKRTGTAGYIMQFDAGDNANGYICNMIGDFILDTTAEGIPGNEVGTGLYVRNVHHSRFDASIRNVKSAGCVVAGGVLSTFNITVSATHLGSFTVTPLNGITIEGSAANTQTTDCYFNLIIETCTGDGVVLNKCGASIFTGTSEGIGGWGVAEGSPTFNFDNVFDTFFCEANTSGDFDISGQGTHLRNCTGTSNNSINVRSGATRISIKGGTFEDATIDSGAEGVLFDSCIIQETITDNTTNGRVQKVNVIESGISSAIRPAVIYQQEGWTNASYAGTWTNTSGTYKSLQYSLNYSTNEVLVRGEAGGGSAGTTIATLPAGYRPSKAFSFICAANGADDFASVTVDTSGNIVHTTGGYTTSIDLSSVRFFLG